MRNKIFWFGLGLSAGAFALLRRYRREQAAVAAWQQQRVYALDVLACPECRRALSLVSYAGFNQLRCGACQKAYPIVDGIPHFIEPQELTGLNRSFSGMYDWFSWVYAAFSKLAFAYIGMNEEQARREVLDRLEPHAGRVLEVSVGPGVNLPYLAGRADVGELYGLDISPGQLSRCRAYVAQKGWDVQLQLGNAEQLPYQDNRFDGVFHIGGINFFNDKKKAIEEMIRVARPGTRILICDENEKGARAYEAVLPGFKRTMGPQREVITPPVSLVPPEMQEVRVYEVWNGWMYCLEFRKP